MTIFTAVNRPAMGAVTHANVIGLLVQLFGVQNALQAGFRAATLPYTPYQVVYGRIADRQFFLDDPYYKNFTELTGVRLPQDQLDVMHALFSPGGAANFLWTTAADPDEPEDTDLMHTICRNELPGPAIVQQLYYYDSVVGRRGTVGGRVFTLAAVEGLIGSLAKDLPQTDVNQANMEAAAYIHVYAAPERVGEAEADEHRGARVRVVHPAGPLGPHRPLPLPEPGQRRAGADYNELPVLVADRIVFPEVPRTSAPDLRRDWRPFYNGIRAVLNRLEHWDGNTMRYLATDNDGHAVVVYIDVDVGVEPPPFFEQMPLGNFRRAFALGELVDLGMQLALAQAWFDRWQAEWLEYSQPAPPDNQPDGPYGMYRNIYCGIDQETVWLFPTFDALHVLGLLAGVFLVPGREQRVDLLPGRYAYTASQFAATSLSWFFQRAMYIRKLDGNELAFSERAAYHLMFSVPYVYRVVISPRELTRAQYPWGNNQALDPLPMLSAGNKSSFIGYDIEAAIAEDSVGVVSVLNTMGRGLAKLDAWARAVFATTGVLVSPDFFTTQPRFVYTVVGVGVFVHPFGLPFRINRREGVVRANLFELGGTKQGARYYSRGVLPFDPGAPVPIHLSREIR
jgi:hypothetical protein